MDYDNPYDLVEEATGSPHIAALSRFGWVSCGGNVYVLECMGKGYMKIEPTILEGKHVFYFDQSRGPMIVPR